MPLSREDARQLVTEFVTHYNEQRLHSAIGYITPRDKLLGRDKEIHAARDRKLAEAREQRRLQRQAEHERRAAARKPDATNAPARRPIDFALDIGVLANALQHTSSVDAVSLAIF